MDENQPSPSRRSLRGLDWLNFFLADVQTGVGPFLAIYLASHHWQDARIGIALSVGGLTGVFAQTPVGALIDRVRRKRFLIALGVALLVVGALALALRPSFPFVIAAQVLLGCVATLFGPTLNAISLGLVGDKRLDRRIGRNQTFNSAGNVTAALLMGFIGYFLSNRAIFFSVAFLAIPTLFSLSFIRPGEIDYERSRGARTDGEPARTSGVLELLKNRTLLVFIVCAALFHFANAAMLPQLGEMLTKGKGRQSALFMSACVITTQLIITLLAAWVGRRAGVWGRKPLLLVGYGVLPVRGVLYVLTSSVPLLVAIQVLDGIANAIFAVVSILMIADLTRGTGRFNLAQGVLATAVGIGASLSTTLAGFVAQRYGYNSSFLTLAAIAAAAFLLVWLRVPETLPSDARQPATSELKQ